ncbi:MAG: ribonuclease P protein component [Deltaproteobacteria bacterium]|nr:ribonuclease P protein component [Deltaproteobacteria bacterium]
MCTRDFTRVVKSGQRRVAGSFVVVLALETDSDGGKPSAGRPRLGVTVSKRVGNAVDRNRVKRRIREWFRRARTRLPQRSAIVVIARRTARDLSSGEIATALDRAIRNFGPEGRQAAVGLR